MKAKNALLFLVSCFMMLSCSDVEPIVVPSSSLSPTVSHSGARMFTTYAPNGTSVTTTDVDPSILGYFQHYWQNDPTTLLGNNSKVSCAATSYMMAANCISLYKGLSYGANATKQQQIFNVVGANANLYQLWAYGNNYNASFLRARLLAVTYSRETLKSWIENYLAENSFIIVGVNAYVTNASNLVHNNEYYSTSSSVNPDVDGSTLPQKYIVSQAIGTSSNGYGVGGHVIIITGLNKNNPAGTGMITYIDPISKGHSPSNRKYVSYTRLLDSIIANSSGGYRVLAISAL